MTHDFKAVLESIQNGGLNQFYYEDGQKIPKGINLYALDDLEIKTIQAALRIADRLQSGEVPHSVIKAMSESKASCDECLKYESLGDHIGYSGENKTHIVIRAAAKAMAAQMIKEESK